MVTRAARQQRWLAPADVVQRLRSRWNEGEFLRDLARGAVWEPLSFGLRSPSAAELATQFGAVQEWLETWRSATVPGVRLEWARVGGRLVGANDLPNRVWIDEREAMWRLLGVRAEVTRYTHLVDLTREQRPGLVHWAADHPLKVLANAQVWPRLLAVVDWMEANASPSLYLRQLDVPGVDTKFVEKHQAILGELLDHTLPPARIDETFARNRFVERYRLARKPSYVRLRRLDGSPLLGGPTSPAELGLRVSDLAGSPVAARLVYIVENEVTYLALPSVDDAVAVLGEGYAVSRLSSLTWLGERDLVYWGDLDTHGFVMLDRLRATFPAARSMLMDRATLLDHEAHWGYEATPVNVVLDRLTPEESALYRDLVENRYGEHLRLEQERLRFSAVRATMTTAG
jgi:hypothetical protein